MLENLERTQAFIPIARPLLGTDEVEAVCAVLTSGNLAQGAVVAEFEEAFAAQCGVRYAVAVTNGTLALHAALLAYGIGPGDEVITAPFTFIASANAIRATGATPVFADIDPETFTIDPDAVQAAVTPRTAAILPIHLFGHAAAMPALMTHTSVTPQVSVSGVTLGGTRWAVLNMVVAPPSRSTVHTSRCHACVIRPVCPS